MGGVFTRLLQTVSWKQKIGVLMTGDAESGKTTILYHWVSGTCVTTSHTVGSNMETLERGDITFTFFDVGGEQRSRPVFQKTLCTNLVKYKKKGIVFVIDSCDRQWIKEAKDLLKDLLESDVLQNVPLLVYANKQDRSDAMSVEDITEAFELDSIKGRPLLVQGCCALTGSGIEGGLAWLADPNSSQDFKGLDPKDADQGEQMC